MENVWEYLRGNKLSRLVWDGYAAIVAACREAWGAAAAALGRVPRSGVRAVGKWPACATAKSLA